MKLLDFGMYSTKHALTRYYYINYISAVNMLLCRKGALCQSERHNFLVIAELRL